MEVYLPAVLGNNDRPTNKPADDDGPATQTTDGHQSSNNSFQLEMCRLRLLTTRRSCNPRAHLSLKKKKSNKYCTGFPIKDARLLKYLKSIFQLFYLPFHHWEDQAHVFHFWESGVLLWETLYIPKRRPIFTEPLSDNSVGKYSKRVGQWVDK